MLLSAVIHYYGSIPSADIREASDYAEVYLMYVRVNEVMSCNVSTCALPKKISWLTMFLLWKVWPKEV